jgi:hypothetical protein
LKEAMRDKELIVSKNCREWLFLPRSVVRNRTVLSQLEALNGPAGAGERVF